MVNATSSGTLAEQKPKNLSFSQKIEVICKNSKKLKNHLKMLFWIGKTWKKIITKTAFQQLLSADLAALLNRFWPLIKFKSALFRDFQVMYSTQLVLKQHSLMLIISDSELISNFNPGSVACKYSHGNISKRSHARRIGLRLRIISKFFFICVLSLLPR